VSGDGKKPFGTGVEERPHSPHRFQTIPILTREAVVLDLRKLLVLPLNDLVARNLFIRRLLIPGVTACCVAMACV